ncbi:MAG TPA: hypothetical protein VGR35_06555 [Tepidisphaeraceae bacterium]|nr:hypothetical protein [Tepidisphaeraceae bacterium]
MNSSKLLVAVVVLQGLTLASLWSGNAGNQLPSANAQAIDPGTQRLQMVEAQRETNAKLDQIIQLLRGELQVRVTTPDEAKEAPAKGK